MEFGESSAIRGQNKSIELPWGFRFDPHPWELVFFYVKPKNFDRPLPIEIPEVDLYEWHPKKLTTEIDSSFGIYGNGRHYYFTRRTLRDQRGSRVIRSMNEGSWKTTSKDVVIKDEKNKKIGYQKSFTFFEFEGNEKNKTNWNKTNWIMHEYRHLNTESETKTDSGMDASTSNGNSIRIEQYYVLCEIYERGKECPTSYPPSTQAITNMGVDAFEEVTGSSIPQNFLLGSILPTSGPLSDSMVFPMVHDSSNGFSMSCDPSGNLNPLESTLLIPDRPCYSDEHTMLDGNSNEFSMSQDLSGNLNPPESTLLIPDRPCYSNELRMFDGISNEFSMSHNLSGNLNPPDLPLLILERPCYNNELPMFRGISNGFSMSHDPLGNLNPPESALLIPDRPCYSNELRMFDGISNEFSMSHDLSGNLNPPESTLLIPDRPCYSNELRMFDDISNEFSMSHNLSGNLNPLESTQLIPGRPCYSNEFPMFRGVSNGFSMSRDQSGNLNPPESTPLIPERPCYNNEFLMYGRIANDFSMSHDLSGNLYALDGEESPLDCHSHLWNHGNL